MENAPGPARDPGKTRSARVSIHDVAREAGVSTATVSNVFNRPQVVAEKTLLRVKEAVSAVGYVPDGAARLMRGAPSPMVGCILLNVANAYYAEVSRGIEDGLHPRGLLALIGSSDADLEREQDYLRLMRSHRVRGIVLNPTDALVRDLPSHQDNHFPIVLIDHPRGGLDLCAVVADHELGGYLLARHLIDLGHRALTLLWPRVDVESVRLREQGVRRAVDEAGLAPDAIRLVRLEAGADGDSLDEALVRRILDDTPRPTALMCFNDTTALRALQYLRRLAVPVPDALSVTGYDDVASSALLTPALTTVRQPTRELGLLAAQLLLAEGDPGHRHEERVLDVELMVRESTSRPASLA